MTEKSGPRDTVQTVMGRSNHEYQNAGSLSVAPNYHVESSSLRPPKLANKGDVTVSLWIYSRDATADGQVLSQSKVRPPAPDKH